MYTLLGIQTEYSLLTSLIRVNDIINYCKEHNIHTAGLLDNNLYGVMEFYDTCTSNNIKPIIGLKHSILDTNVYLYAKNYLGYQDLLTISIDDDFNKDKLNKFLENNNIYLVIPFKYISNYQEFLSNENVYVSYKERKEMISALLYTNRVLLINEIKTLEKEKLKYLKYLYRIGDMEYTEDYNYPLDNVSIEDINRLEKFTSTINIYIDKKNRYIPIYNKDINSKKYLSSLSLLGLKKRLNNNVTKEYLDRLNYELSVIDNMGFNDYFLIVYDYVKYAKTHNILVGPGRGSAAGSLVSFTLGITEIDPIKYNLLFERFLNKDRVTMPDIDIDFEDTKREEMISYVKDRYGSSFVAPILTYGTLQPKQVIKDIGRVLNVDVDTLTKQIDAKTSLKDNLLKESVKSLLQNNSSLKKVYEISLVFEGLKRHTSTHAAGIVISSVPLISKMPIIKVNGGYNTGITMNYLEELGFLKMDFLALSNLSFIHNILDNIDKDFNINKIPLDDLEVYSLFQRGDTAGIFQFESSGMINFLKKLSPTNFNDLYAAVALFRPGPMDNIDLFIKRKKGIIKTTYLHKDLEPILKETYGVIVYQEQIMQILVKMGGYSFSEADNIRRAMSKKKKEIIILERDNFIKRGINLGYEKPVLESVYDLILKFANYGFNKAHSVSYAYLGYQMAYLKVHYKEAFLSNLLNLSISSINKTKEYLNMAKYYGIKLFSPSINISYDKYIIKENSLILPLTLIKGISDNIAKSIIEERKKGVFTDYFDTIHRLNSIGIKKNILENLIYGYALSFTKLNIKTMITNLDDALSYSDVVKSFDTNLIDKPLIKEYPEYTLLELMNKELEIYGFYISNHPASKYNTLKIRNINKYLGKIVNIILLIENIRVIKTKNGLDMAFITSSDETGNIDIVVFPKYIELLKSVEVGNCLLIKGSIARRLDKYQINLLNIEKRML